VLHSGIAVTTKPLTVESAGPDEQFVAPTYSPLDVVISSGAGATVYDTEGGRYLDFLAGYSALNFGHSNPRLLEVAHKQLDRLTLTSRAFRNEILGPFCAELAGLCELDGVIPMNTGAEAVETAIKAARRWGYLIKGVPEGRAKIIVASGAFHGRTTTIVGFSDDPLSNNHFGPYAPGFATVPYGDAAAIESAIDGDAVALLIEPIQGEAGVIVPPAGYLRDLRALCDENDVLLMFDEVQSGLGRTGLTFACDHENVRPDVFVLGKALGGGIVPISAVVATSAVINTFVPGSHGSTFGGNPFASAVAREVIAILNEGGIQARTQELGVLFANRLEKLIGRGAVAVRSRGLWAGIDLDLDGPDGRTMCERLARRGVLAKETHGHTIRLAPPLIISKSDLLWGCDQIVDAFVTSDDE
jgi:ornithine--oxo-acid transaminase